jgi:hypothetical protein
MFALVVIHGSALQLPSSSRLTGDPEAIHVEENRLGEEVCPTSLTDLQSSSSQHFVHVPSSGWATIRPKR